MAAHFTLKKEFTWTNGIKISHYTSLRTSMSIILADVQGPLVEGAFTLATEAHDDDGCPHTLEHLVFLGSEKYPYKGMLDHAANRCLAQGTNAWTDVDHTAYTLTTAGSEGFLNLLPVYLDHILYPTITDSGFDTEVHHITATGEDAGVVYSEMQGRENTAFSLIWRKMLQAIYPGDCGYKSETGGIMANLRDLTVHKVRSYHKSYYRPDNLCLIITGIVDPQQLFEVVAKYEDERILSKEAYPPMQRPWTSPVPPFTTSVTEEVKFPSDDEETGSIILAWRGPHWQEFDELVAIETLWSYLTESAVSPLQQVFVEIEDPYCTEISPSVLTNLETVRVTRFEDVPTEKLTEIKDLFFKTMQEICTKGIDMQRMHDIIHKSILDHYNSVEEKPHREVQSMAIGFFLYGTKEDDLNESMSVAPRLEALKQKDNSFWINLIKKYILDRPYVCVIGRPSASLGTEMQQAEKQRIQEQCKKLGEAKLKELGEQLKASIAKNNVTPPQQLLKEFKIPDVKKIPLIPVATIRNDEPVTRTEDTKKILELLNNDKSDKLPFFIEFDHVSSAFVQFRVLLDTTDLPVELRPFIELYLDVMYELPILRDNKLIPHEEVVAELERDTVSYSNSVGFTSGSNFVCGAWSSYVILDLKFEVSKYQKGIQWLKELLWNTQFTKERLKVGVGKLIADAPKHKRKGDKMARAALLDINYSNVSNHCVTNAVRQQKFLKALDKQLNKKNGDEILKQIEQFRTHLCHPKNMRIQVVCNVEKLSQPKKGWESFLPAHLADKKHLEQLSDVHYAREFLSDDAKNGGKGYIIGMSAVESAFLFQSAYSSISYGHEDEAPLLVAIEYLTALEGVFWNRIRGQGLAYGYNISLQIESGLITFVLSRATNVMKAYEVAKDIINEFLNKQLPFEETALEAARSSVIFGIISEEENVEAAALEAFLFHLKKLGPDGNKDLLSRVQQVQLNDVVRVVEKYLIALFDTSKTNVAISCNPSKVGEATAAFEKMNRKLVSTKVDELFK